MMIHLIGTVVEWNGFGEEPHLLIATNENAATRQLFEHMHAMGEALTGGFAQTCDAPAWWLEENPMPPVTTDDLAEVRAWLEGLHEYAGSPWWSAHEIAVEMDGTIGGLTWIVSVEATTDSNLQTETGDRQ